MTGETDTDNDRRIVESLLAWYRRERAALPWRDDPTPWRVLVSELMLQQTTVKAVIPYFERFLDRFPEPAALAAAGENEVLALWSGLGYYRRARMLHAAAGRIEEDHGGRVPDDAALLRELPGVGEYTTAAVGSIAFGLPLAVVDGNVERVMARLFALPGGKDDSRFRRRVREAADRLLPETAPGDFNQAVMELGRVVCTPRSPRCLVCPLAKPCVSRRRGDAERRPRPPARKAVRNVTHRAAYVVRAGRVLLTRRPEGGRMAGMLELPTCPSDAIEGLRSLLTGLGFEAEVGEIVTTVRHSILSERITLRIHRVELTRTRRRRRGDSWRFATRTERSAMPLTTATSKALNSIGELTT